MPNNTNLTPQERLTLSRNALLRHMNRQQDSDDLEYALDGAEPPGRHQARLPWNAVTQALRLWWHRHPASAVVELTKPLLADYAAEHPYRLLGAAAGLGALGVWARPWRMVSIGGLLLAAVRSSGLSGSLLSLVTHRSSPIHKNQNN